MRFTKRNELNISKWDSIVESSSKNAIFSYSWYLDAVSKNWGVLHNTDWSISMALSCKKILFWTIIYPPLFSRNSNIFGDIKKYTEIVDFALNKFWKCNIKLSEICSSKHKNLIYQKLSLKENFSYHQNSKRIIKKNFNSFTFKQSENYYTVLNFYFNNSYKKLKLANKHKVKITKLMQNALKNKKAEVIEAYNNKSELVGASFFLFDKETVYYLVGDCLYNEKKNGLMFSIMDYAINTYKNDFIYFDFGGSNVESVATFYRKMGGTDIKYYEYFK